MPKEKKPEKQGSIQGEPTESKPPKNRPSHVAFQEYDNKMKNTQFQQKDLFNFKFKRPLGTNVEYSEDSNSQAEHVTERELNRPKDAKKSSKNIHQSLYTLPPNPYLDSSYRPQFLEKPTIEKGPSANIYTDSFGQGPPSMFRQGNLLAEGRIMKPQGRRNQSTFGQIQQPFQIRQQLSQAHTARMREKIQQRANQNAFARQKGPGERMLHRILRPKQSQALNSGMAVEQQRGFNYSQLPSQMPMIGPSSMQQIGLSQMPNQMLPISPNQELQNLRQKGQNPKKDTKQVPLDLSNPAFGRVDLNKGQSLFRTPQVVPWQPQSKGQCTPSIFKGLREGQKNTSKQADTRPRSLPSKKANIFQVSEQQMNSKRKQQSSRAATNRNFQTMMANRPLNQQIIAPRGFPCQQTREISRPDIMASYVPNVIPTSYQSQQPLPFATYDFPAYSQTIPPQNQSYNAPFVQQEPYNYLASHNIPILNVGNVHEGVYGSQEAYKFPYIDQYANMNNRPIELATHVASRLYADASDISFDKNKQGLCGFNEKHDEAGSSFKDYSNNQVSIPICQPILSNNMNAQLSQDDDLKLGQLFTFIKESFKQLYQGIRVQSFCYLRHREKIFPDLLTNLNATSAKSLATEMNVLIQALNYIERQQEKVENQLAFCMQGLGPLSESALSTANMELWGWEKKLNDYLPQGQQQDRSLGQLLKKCYIILDSVQQRLAALLEKIRKVVH